MTTTASMIKKVPVSVISEDSSEIADMFDRNSDDKFRGVASFGDGSTSVLLEVADTLYSKTKGLMGRKSLPQCCGMLFTGLRGGYFWMKNCLIPLDIVFLDDNGTVTRKYSMEADGGKKHYSYGDEKRAIELAYGFCDSHNVDVGTKVKVRTW